MDAYHRGDELARTSLDGAPGTGSEGCAGAVTKGNLDFTTREEEPQLVLLQCP